MSTKRMIAAEQGKIIYLGNQCAKCGTSEKYTSGGGCVFCVKAKAKVSNETKRKLIKGLLEAAKEAQT